MLKVLMSLLSVLVYLSITPASAATEFKTPEQNLSEKGDSDAYKSRLWYLQDFLKPSFLDSRQVESLGIEACTIQHPQLQTTILSAMENTKPAQKHPNKYYLLGVLIQEGNDESHDYYLVVTYPNGDCAQVKPVFGLEEFIPGSQQAVAFELKARLWNIKDVVIDPNEEVLFNLNTAEELGHACDPVTQTTRIVNDKLWGVRSKPPCGLRNQRLPLVWDRLPQEMRIPPQGKSRR